MHLYLDMERGFNVKVPIFISRQDVSTTTKPIDQIPLQTDGEHLNSFKLKQLILIFFLQYFNFSDIFSVK